MALSVPAPNFDKTEKMLPKKMAEIGFIKPATIVPVPEIVIEIKFPLVVNANKDLQVGRASAGLFLSIVCMWELSGRVTSLSRGTIQSPAFSEPLVVLTLNNRGFILRPWR